MQPKQNTLDTCVNKGDFRVFLGVYILHRAHAKNEGR